MQSFIENVFQMINVWVWNQALRFRLSQKLCKSAIWISAISINVVSILTWNSIEWNFRANQIKKTCGMSLKCNDNFRPITYSKEAETGIFFYLFKITVPWQYFPKKVDKTVGFFSFFFFVLGQKWKSFACI